MIIALILYIMIVMYVHNNIPNLLTKYNNVLPVIALASYYFIASQGL